MPRNLPEPNTGIRRQSFIAHRRAAGDQKDDTTNKNHRAKRGDERIAHASDDDAIDVFHERAGGNAGSKSSRNASFHHSQRGNTSGQCGGRANGEIEAAADNDERHPHGNHRHDGRLDQYVVRLSGERKRSVNKAVTGRAARG